MAGNGYVCNVCVFILYMCFELSQLSCLGSSVGRASRLEYVKCGFESLLRYSSFSLENAVSRFNCVVLLFFLSVLNMHAYILCKCIANSQICTRYAEIYWNTCTTKDTQILNGTGCLGWCASFYM